MASVKATIDIHNISGVKHLHITGKSKIVRDIELWENQDKKILTYFSLPATVTVDLKLEDFLELSGKNRRYAFRLNSKYGGVGRMREFIIAEEKMI